MQLPPLFKERMHALLGEEYASFIAGYERPLRRGLRVNTTKITTEAFCALFPYELEPSPFAADSFYLDALHKAGSDPLHHAGAYYMQEPSAASAVTVLDVQPGQSVLDLCAAPGGKSTQIAAALRNTGLLWSNEYVSARARILQQNMERWGIRNHVISNRDTADICNALTDRFDRVLVDAPCSGEGMFRKEPQAVAEWSIENIRLCAARQDEILNNAAKAVKPGGRLVYSTCTFAPEENEGTVIRFLQRHPEFSLLPINVSWGLAGFSVDRIRPFCHESDDSFDTTLCRRIFPQHGGEGHFIAAFQRADDAIGLPPSRYPFPLSDPNAKAAEELYRDCFLTAPEGRFVTFGDQVRLLPQDTPDCRGLGIAGVAVATICKNRLEPCHSIFVASAAADCRRRVEFFPDDPRLIAYLHGEEIPYDGEKGWTAVCVAGVTVGFGKSAGGRLKNRYPKGLRLL